MAGELWTDYHRAQARVGTARSVWEVPNDAKRSFSRGLIVSFHFLKVSVHFLLFSFHTHIQNIHRYGIYTERVEGTE